MNRIYQGRVTRVEILNSKDQEPELLDNWEERLWRHHELFQDAVNYYTLALAAMTRGLAEDSTQAKAARAWREQVRNSWVQANRKGVSFPGPHTRLASLLGVKPNESEAAKAFDASAAALLENCRASTEVLAKALLQLLEEADQSDLNQFCVSRLPWLCTPHGQLDATPKNIVQQQETRMLAAVRSIHETSIDQLSAVAKELDLGCFVTQAPKERLTGQQARVEAERLFRAAGAKAKGLVDVADRFAGQLTKLGDTLALPCLGRKPKGAYPLAVVFKLLPVSETWEAFKTATASLKRKADKVKDTPSRIETDFIAEARTTADRPLFDYFTNRALFRDAGNKDRAVWFGFDLAAFIEAIKSPHRFFQDTLTREKEAEDLREQKLAMEGRGLKKDSEHEEEEEEGTFGFEGDKRIDLLREMVTNTLGFVAEAEDPGARGQTVAYTIQQRTLRGFEEIKERWCKLAVQGKAAEKALLEVLAKEQARHRDDFGSATLYRALAQPKYHPIWRDAGTEKWHAADPLKAWRAYTELCFELSDAERPIRFTPAHPEHSPRYFIIPKQGRFGSEHQSSRLAFTCGFVIKAGRRWEPKQVRVTYSAPRMRRDELRHNGQEDLEAVPWLQPMIKALELPETDQQDFANCRVTLQPERLRARRSGKPGQPVKSEDRYAIQLTFPVEVNTERLVSNLGKAAPWSRQFNQSPDGDNFRNASLRWPHEKQLAKPPVPWHEQCDSFQCLATDLGQRDAGAFARLAARCDGNPGRKASRFVGQIGNTRWVATLEQSGLLRLPGEDARVWRRLAERDRQDGEDPEQLFGFREELWGEQGRPARGWEADDTAELMRQLEATEKDRDGNETFTLFHQRDWREELSFPQQNDKLLVAMRRYQSRISRLHRWCWFLAGDGKQQDAGWSEIAGCEDARLVSAGLREQAAKRDPRVLEELRAELRHRLKAAPALVERIAQRVLPLRGRSWKWEPHPAATAANPLHRLTQDGPSLDSKDKPIWLRGQRGLSLERIEQVEELRKRFQSLNQLLRRKIGGPPPIRRDESVPDPCPDLLEKLENLKEQRVNQTAHMILAAALGLRLAPPAPDKQALRQEKDVHGAYEKACDKRGRWVGPVDFIVIEDLSRYRATQGRSPRENGRLMEWCHRAVRDKLCQLCEVFGLPVVETPAAYSSRFCSRSGVPGFRAQEVVAGFTGRGQWAWLAAKEESPGKPTAEAVLLQRLEGELTQAQKELESHWAGEKRLGAAPQRSLLVPASIGPIFVPVVDAAEEVDLQPAVVQADVNAAINLALRAIADPRLWSIYPRLRTQRDAKDGSPAAREKRKFGDRCPPKLSVAAAGKPIAETTRNPNFFADLAGLREVAGRLAKQDPGLKWLTAEWTAASLAGDAPTPPLLHSKSFWGTVKAAQWARIQEINGKRLAAWRDKLNVMPD